ncbi:lactonase family protein [Lentibacillus saliphilus]|uniref:lactonase family protein n=1 Tax=Lentibacillus saliphilus TaxID=2737028 RepID=UPI001C309F74|nr:lactonase family protein [Lentibacillus saliphilus]
MAIQEDGYIVYTGTYGTEQDQAIQVLTLDKKARFVKQLSAVQGIANPSYVTVNQKQDTLYALSEVQDGHVSSYPIDRDTHHVQKSSSQQGDGVEGPCYIMLDETERYLFVVNYGGGSLSVYRLADDHTILELTDHQTYPAGSHPHMIVQIPGTKRYVVTDLGHDKLYLYECTEGKLTRIQECAATPGSGPRHAAIFPEHRTLYVVNEFHSQVSVYTYDPTCSSLELVQEIDTIAEPLAVNNYGADIHIAYESSFLYTSNRGHDSLSVFHIGDDGLLSYVDHVSTEGKWPRNFVITPDERFMLIANEKTHSIVVMEIGAEGVPVYTGEQYSIQAPVCLKVFEI